MRAQFLDQVEACIDAIIERVGPEIVIGIPLGLGKPVHLINALYARARADSSLSLTILTALSLEKPQAVSALEKAFLEPFLERVYGDCPDLSYVLDRRRGALPDNVRVHEFYVLPGSMLGLPEAQQDYICSNYSHAARDVFNRGCNVAAQAVAHRLDGDEHWLSMSSNPDTSPELAAMLRAAQARGERRVCLVAEVNDQLPYMAHDAEVSADLYHLMLDHPRYHTRLFSTPKRPVQDADYMIGLRTSSLLRDGGTLQIGIGALGDAIVHAARLRHQHNRDYRDLLEATGMLTQAAKLIEQFGGLGPFEQGLYGSSEMFVDGFLHLYTAGILKRPVYDFWALQQLINDGRCDPNAITPEVLEGLESLGVRVIRGQDFEILRHHGLFNDDTRYDEGHLIAPDGTRVLANVADPEARAVMAQQCLGTALRNGLILHGAFFVGPNDFYQALRDMPETERRRICMTGVNKVNQLDVNPRLYKAQRIHARFVNTAMMVTLSGAAVSDGLDDGRVVSGVGGQFNFVDMAHHLPGGRSIIMVRAVREKAGGASSNIVWNYAHCTIPRHLRDIVVTEYGIADLRSKTDAEIAAALIEIADARFQPELIRQAQQAGKLPADYHLPEHCRLNTPEHVRTLLHTARHNGQLPDYPFGHDFTEVELGLTRALKRLRSLAAGRSAIALAWAAWRAGPPPASSRPYLERMGLLEAGKLREHISQRLLARALRETGVG